MAARAVSTFSLALLLVALVGAQTFTGLRDRIQGLPAERVFDIVSTSDRAMTDPEIRKAVEDAADADEDAFETRVGTLRGMIELKALGEGAPGRAGDAVAAAKEIKRSPLYRDTGVDEESNWLGRALARLRNIRFDLPRRQWGDGPAFRIGPWLIYIVWGVLGAAAAYLIYLALRHVQWKASLARRAKAVLEEDEPERTLDEWLTQADDLAAQGRYREAVRALYLACLLRFDEHRVARFIRGETNWEHLARIQASDRRPADLDFRAPTQAFDRIWYGKQTRGQEDVDQFRAWYRQITDTLSRRAAA